MGELPAGTVTFLLTDIESSSRHWEQAPDEMRAALAVHDAVAGDVINACGGSVVKHMGDGCWAAFPSAPAAAQAAIDIQRRLQAERDEIRARLDVRIGLHTGEVDPTEGDYFGPVPNRSARVAELANGNQIVCSAGTAGLLADFDLRSDGMHELRGIGVEEIFLIVADGVESDPRPLRRPVPPTNLPRTHTSFIGRSNEKALAVAFLEEHHSVVTLVGPGGVGKTRLAIEVGAEVAESRGGVVQFCDLAAISEADAVAATIADAIGARKQPGIDLVDSIADYVAARDLLIILDNCEHVVHAVAALVVRLAAADGVDLLATSRAALGVEGEQILSVQPLPPETDGLELFVGRARQSDPSFELTEENETEIREITRRLDGIPLAIELAAARIRLMTPSELVTGLDDRFRLLGRATRRERQETLRDTVEWSYRLLSPSQAAVFTRMSVFAGGAGLDAVTGVCADGESVTRDEIPDLVLALVEQSMVVSTVEGGHRRFSLLETIRGFGNEELAGSGERDTYRRRHADYYRELAQRENQRMLSPAEPDAWRVLDLEWDNLRIALDTFEDEVEVDLGAELVVALVWYGAMAMRFELFAWAEELLETPGIDAHPAYTDLCGAAALGAYFTVSGRVTDLAEAGLAADPSDPEGFCRIALAAVFLNNVHTAEASDSLTSAWLASSPATTGGRLWAEGFRTFHLCTHGPAGEAAAHAQATMRIASETKSVTAKSLAAWAQGMVVSFDDLDRAIEIWTSGLEWPRSMPGDHLVEQLLDGLILNFTVSRDDLLSALKHCRDAVQGALDRHYYVGTSHLFGVTAIALTRSGDAETGARLVGTMVAHGHLPRSNARRVLDEALGDAVEALQAAGATMSVTEAGFCAVAALDAAILRAEEGA